jgi:peptidoglycan/xylan/chitin deacetylase (PgdA/CDA1 family)
MPGAWPERTSTLPPTRRSWSPSSLPLEDFLLRIVLLTAVAAPDEAHVWRTLASTPTLALLVLRLRQGDARGSVAVAGLTPVVDRDSPLARIHVGDVLSQAECARLVRDWGADIGVVLNDASVAPELRDAPRQGTLALRHGWAGQSEAITAADAVVAMLVAEPAVPSGKGGRLASARAPIYADDSLADLERRGAELSLALLRETLLRLEMATTPPMVDVDALRRWPSGLSRARIAAALLARRAMRRMIEPAWLLKTVAALLLVVIVAPARALWRTLRRRHSVRVFNFHRVSHLCRDGMTVAPDVFARQIAAVRRSHRVVGLDEAITLFRSGARLARPVAAITFDDAYRSVIDVAAPIMARAGVTGCCFVTTEVVGPGRRFAHDDDSPVREYLDVMSWEEIAELRRAGWMIGAHTATHPRLAQCDAAALQREIAATIPVLRDRVGDSTFPFAYPFGGERDITPLGRHLVARLGYTACLSSYGGENVPAGDSYAMQRIDLGGDHSVLAWWVRVRGMDLGTWRPRWLRSSNGPGVVHAA